MSSHSAPCQSRRKISFAARVVPASPKIVTKPLMTRPTFGVSSDDGFRLRLTSGATKFESLYDNPRSANDTLAIFNIPAAGVYQLELIFFEAGAGSELELFAARGGSHSFTATAVDPFGTPPTAGPAPGTRRSRILWHERSVAPLECPTRERRPLSGTDSQR